MSNDVRAINEMVQRESAFIDPILHEVHKVVVGQDVMIERILRIGETKALSARFATRHDKLVPRNWALRMVPSS